MGDLLSETASEIIQRLLADARSTTIREHGPFGNIYVRPMDFPDVGSVVRGHTHNYDHLTIVMRGALLCRAYASDPNDSSYGHVGPTKEVSVEAPALIRVRKTMWHEFVALKPRSFAMCVFALRDREGNVVNDESEEWVTTCSY